MQCRQCGRLSLARQGVSCHRHELEDPIEFSDTEDTTPAPTPAKKKQKDDPIESEDDDGMAFCRAMIKKTACLPQKAKKIKLSVIFAPVIVVSVLK